MKIIRGNGTPEQRFELARKTETDRAVREAKRIKPGRAKMGGHEGSVT